MLANLSADDLIRHHIQIHFLAGTSRVDIISDYNECSIMINCALPESAQVSILQILHFWQCKMLPSFLMANSILLLGL